MATSPSASCCRRSTGWPTTGGCPPGFAVVGISRTPLTDEQFREKMREAVEKFCEDTTFDDDVWAGFARGPVLHGRRHRRPRAVPALAAKLGRDRAARATPAATCCSISRRSPASTRRSRTGIGAAGLAQGQRLAAPGGREAVRPRPGERARTERPTCTKSSTSPRSTASIITWARRRCRTSWPSASATASSSRCGTGAT